MRVLIATQWFPPEPRPMFLEMARGLKELGHEVTVVTGFPNWPGGKIYPGFRIRLFQREVIDGVPVLRLPLYPDHSHSRSRRILNLTSLGVSLVVLGPWLLKRPDVIHVVQLPTLFFACRLFGLGQVPVTVEIQDLWPESLEATGMMSSRRILTQVKRMCERMYKHAARIRVISPGFKGNLASKGVPLNKIRVIDNWVDILANQPEPANKELGRKLGTEGKFNVLYAGSIGLPQALDTVLEAAELLRDELQDVQFLIAGDGVELPRLTKVAEQLGLTNVKFLGSFSGKEMPAIYALADVLLVHLRDDPLFAITIPSKIVSYLAYGKPILAAVSGNPADVVVNAGAGIECRPQDPKALAEAVRRLRALPAHELEAMGCAGRKAATEVYSQDVLVPKLGQMIEEAARSR